MNKEKMMKTARSLDTFFKVIRRIIAVSMIVAVCVIAVLTVVNWINPDAVIGEGFASVDLGPLTIELAPEYAPDNHTILLYSWIYIALGAICAAVIYYALGQIRQILRPMMQGDPFHASVSESIRRIGYVCLVLGVAQNVAGAVETVNVIRNFGLDRLVSGGQIVSVTANFSVDLTFLLVFFLLMLTSYIFRYGAELQKLSDETL